MPDNELRVRLARPLAGHAEPRDDRGIQTASGCTCGHRGAWREHYATLALNALAGVEPVAALAVLADRLAYITADRDFEREMRKFATSAAATIADLDEVAPALRQLLRRETERRKQAEERLAQALREAESRG